MATTCFKSIRSKVLRATRLDVCGAPVAGAGNTVTTNGQISVAYSFEVDEGEEIFQLNGNGDPCINVPGCSTIKWMNIEIALCSVDPTLVAMLTGWPTVLDGEANIVGFRVRDTVLCSGGVAIETWSDFPGQGCTDPAEKPYNYFLAPYVQQFRLDDFTLENGAATFTLTGGKTALGSGWGVGPYNVVRDALDAPSPLLTAIGPNDHFHTQVTTVAPPAAACGATTLTPVEP